MAEIKNKSEFVRGVLREIGALTDPAPAGWRQKVEEALQRENIQMHQVMIYQIRRAAMDKPQKKQSAPATNAPGATNGAKQVVKQKPIKSRSEGDLTVTDLLNARKLADQFGGATKLSAALNALNTLVGVS